MKRLLFTFLFLAASVGMSYAQDPGVVSSGTKGGMSYTFYDNGLLEISGSGALPGNAFTNWNGGFGASVKNIRFAEDCEVYGLNYMWFGCYTQISQLETIEINSVAPIMFSGTSGGAGITYKQDGAVTLTITAPAIVDVDGEIIDNYGSPVNMIFNMPATTVFEKKWFSSLANNFAVTIPTGATGHIPAGYVFKDSHDQREYDEFVAHDHEDMFWDRYGDRLVEGVDYTLGEESTFEITAENASQIFGRAAVSFQAPTQASNSEWVFWRESDLKTFSDMSSGDQKVCKDVTVKVNNGVYNTDSGFGLHFESLDEDGVQFVAPEGKVFKRIVILNEYGTFSDSNWSYDSNYKKWSGSANTVGFVGNICGISLIEFELGDSKPAYETVMNLINEIPNPVVLTAECKAKIDAARAAYDALSTDDKALVTNIATLTKAETDYTALNQAEADKVIAKIAAIPQPVTLKLATRDSIESARTAYDALTAEQKALVSNYAVLEAAEATWAGLINVAPAGALSGKYTINDGGDFIYFAHGNLQYTRENLDADWSTGTFRLATNQYDLIEPVKTYPDAYCTDNYGDKTAVGLFGWGTWGEGKTPNLTSSDKTLYTWSTDFSGTLEGTSTWRTLTKDEWVYLLEHNNLSFATVHDVNGLLVAPDGKDIDGKSMADWVVINDETWTTMQNDGYLFLPACGQRSQISETANITTGGQGEEVVYYSSTEKEDDANRAYNIWYKKDQAPAAADYSFKRQAFGVRLVSAGVNPLDQAQAVKDLIDAIPAEITLDDNCVKAIDDARAAYDALRTEVQGALDDATVAKLTGAEDALALLKADHDAANAVIAKINAIGDVEYTTESKALIDAAREAYDALTEGQQNLVTNSATLTTAESTYASLKAAADLTAAAYDLNTLIESAQEDYESVPALPKYASIAEQLLDAINTAKGIAENSEATLSELQTAKTNLQTAYDKFNEDMSGTVTNVDKVNTDASESDVWFDLSGRRLQGKPTTPGLYINNGRKAIVK